MSVALWNSILRWCFTAVFENPDSHAPNRWVEAISLSSLQMETQRLQHVPVLMLSRQWLAC